MALVINSDQIRQAIPQMRAGDEVVLSGAVYTARDAAHKKIAKILAEGGELPFPLKDAVIYYAGPTPAPKGRVCGSFGPTTSERMDAYPQLFDSGLAAAIGKGARSETIKQALVRNGSVYLIAVGGAGALAARHIISLEEIAFPELGCESVKRLVFRDFPLITAVDSLGGDIFER